MSNFDIYEQMWNELKLFVQERRIWFRDHLGSEYKSERDLLKRITGRMNRIEKKYIRRGET